MTLQDGLIPLVKLVQMGFKMFANLVSGSDSGSLMPQHTALHVIHDYIFRSSRRFHVPYVCGLTMNHDLVNKDLSLHLNNKTSFLSCSYIFMP